MKQVLQSLRTGATEIADVPAPSVKRGCLLIESSRSLISAGTERMLVEFGRANVVAKARRQPEKVKLALEKARTDGVLPTLAAIRHKLDQPLALGYCNVGRVLELGDDARGFSVGDRVASNGNHAGVVNVPTNLCARVPDAVSDDHAAFTVVGAIALQGVRLAQPTLGEAVVVTGLGLIGLIAAQLLRASGCRVLGIDFDPARLAIARALGVETLDLSAGQDALAAAAEFSRGRGVDAVIIAASTSSDEPVRDAAHMCRQRGRIVLVGVAGLHLSRDDFYKKELTFQVSSSYGPGRYDPNYEEKGNDYPIGFVRWTQQRNFEAVLDMMAGGRIDVAPLITHRFAIEDAAKAYDAVSGRGPGSSLGVLLEYPSDGAPATARARTIVVSGVRPGEANLGRAPSVSFIGAGNYATAVLIPAFKAAGASLATVASSGGVSSLHAARRFGFQRATTETPLVFADPDSDAVVIATRHDSHARLVREGLLAGKSVFVEKPLCMTLDELEEIEALYARLSANGRAPRLGIGFNRRFAPHVVTLKRLLGTVTGPKAMVMTVNAGALPQDHWTLDAKSGGGRIIGEACHFVDLLRFLAASPIRSHSATAMRSAHGDTVTMQLSFDDGSIGTIHYFANGSRAFPKERIEVFAQQRVVQLDNYRRLTAFGWPRFASKRLWRQDKGQRACAAAFLGAMARNEPSPIAFDEIVEVNRATIELAEWLR